MQVRSEEECQGELRALGDRLLKQQGTLAYLDGRNYSYSSGLRIVNIYSSIKILEDVRSINFYWFCGGIRLENI